MFSGRELSNPHLFNEEETVLFFINHMLLDATGNPAEDLAAGYPISIFKSVNR